MSRTISAASLHKHFLEPGVIENAAHMPPKRPGFSIEMKPETLQTFAFKAGDDQIRPR